MHIPFSMSDEPDLGDEFKCFEELPTPPPMRRGDGDSEPLTRIYHKYYEEGYNQGYLDAIAKLILGEI